MRADYNNHHYVVSFRESEVSEGVKQIKNINVRNILQGETLLDLKFMTNNVRKRFQQNDKFEHFRKWNEWLAVANSLLDLLI